VVDETDPAAESDLRRRAFWLLAMLAVVAVLLVVVISAVAGTDNGGKQGNGQGPLDGEASTSSARTTPSHHTPTHHRTHTQARSSTSPQVGHGSCPTSETCILDGDVGNGIQAINDYRTQHGKPAVPGSVSRQAQTCALHNGSGCSGGWAETELATPDGAEAVHKMLEFAKFLDPDMTSVEVGWAYDPHAKLYYFAIVRND
jgi:hypothetical protein